MSVLQNEREKMKKSKRIFIFILFLILFLVINLILALLLDTDNATNVFTMGKVEISLTESNWAVGDNGSQKIIPGDTISKNPVITNIGKNPAYVYIQVEIPIVSAVLTDSSGNVLNNGVSQNTELFSIVGLDTTNWGEFENSGQTVNGKKVYTYYYKNALNVNSATTALFTGVSLAHIKGIDTASQQILVKAYAIQSQDLKSGEGLLNNGITNMLGMNL